MTAARVLLLLPPNRLAPPARPPLHAPLFTALMAAALREAGHAPIVVDLHLHPRPSPAALDAVVAQADPDQIIVLHSDYNRQVAPETIAEVVARLKAGRPARPVVLGGRLSLDIARAALREATAADGALVGEPEASAVAFVSGQPAGLLRQPDGPAPAAPLPVDPPVPAWDLVQLSAYGYAPHQSTAEPVVPVLASRGCPHPCFWCEVRDQGAYARRPVEQVLAELRLLMLRDGVRSVFFADPTFGVDPRWTTELLEGMAGLPPLRWSAMVRPDHVHGAMLRRFRAAGCWSVLYGVESLNPAAQRAAGKGLSAAVVGEAIGAAKAAGLEVIASALVGLPGDDPAGFRATVEQLVNMGPDFAQFFTIRVPPHRALPAGARRAGALEGGRHDFTGQVVLSDGFRDSAELEALRRWAFRRFYLRPAYVGGLLHRKLRAPDAAHQLARLARGGLLAARMSLPGMAP
ncbi:MAG: B12-binding domain-containing radical SAM protein [Deltaproteobacteria bacterium]|nr:B12-binding domain-containing radical SAM protein [Deltaproteobacteria bacterium]